MNYPNYRNYKASGVEWLGEIPKDWKITKFRNLVSLYKGKAPDELFDTQTTSNQVPYLSMDYLRGNTEDVKWVHPTSKTKLATNQDVLLLWDGSNAGEFILAKEGAVSSTMALLNNTSLNQEYFLHVCKTIEIDIKNATIGMGIPHVNGDYLKESLIPIPSMEEQTAIAAFLDRETTKIERLILEKQHLIDLLKEKRQANISHTVTKGLIPDAPMKDSGVEWLGLVPKHWKIQPLKSAASCNDDVLLEKTDPTYEILYVDISSVDAFNGIVSKEVMLFSNAPSRARRLVKDGDVIISTVRTYLRAIASIKKPEVNLVVSTGFAVIRPRKGVVSNYLGYLLKTNFFIDTVISHSVGVSYPAINKSELISIKIPMPSTEEQISIAAFLDSTTHKIDALINEAQNAITLLHERRRALISAAVTGKIDVRKLSEKELE